MKWLISTVRSHVFYFVAAAFAITSFLELFFGRTIKWIPTWAHVLILIGGTAGIVISLLADRYVARNSKPD